VQEQGNLIARAAMILRQNTERFSLHSLVMYTLALASELPVILLRSTFVFVLASIAFAASGHSNRTGNSLDRSRLDPYPLVDPRARDPIRHGLVVEATQRRTPAIPARATRLPERHRTTTSTDTKATHAPEKLVRARHADTRRSGLRRDAHALKRPVGKRPSARRARTRARTPRKPPTAGSQQRSTASYYSHHAHHTANE
jgi:hypothetical protein